MAARPKPGSRAEREALRHEMLQTGCGFAEIVAEMRTRWRMRPREAWRHAHGWTLQQVADHLDTAAITRPGSALAADASLIGKWEKWPAPSGRRPTLRVLTLLADVYDCAAEELLDLEDRRQLPAAELRLLSRPQPPAEAMPQGTANPVDAPPVPPGVGLVRATAAESAAWAHGAEATNVGDLALEQLFSDTRALAIDYISGDPLTVFTRVRRLRDHVFALLEGRQYPRQTADLYTTAGYLCGLLAWISSDLGQLREADTQGRTAWLCAELAGHNDLRAWVLSTRSKIAFWDGRLRDAVSLARLGATYQPRGTAGVLLACQEADSWSLLGAEQEARAALAKAVDARDTATGTDEVAGIFSCTDFRRANYASAVLVRIGDPHDALREVGEALTSRAPQAYGTLAQVRIVQAFAYLALGQPDGAISALRPVLALQPHQRLDTLNRRLRELAATAARSSLSDSASVLDLQAAIEAWSLESVPNTLALAPGQEPK